MQRENGQLIQIQVLMHERPNHTTSSTTLFVMEPIFSISTVTSSPAFSQIGDGFRKHPTPGGVLQHKMDVHE
jgi:hypothetical protein